ncbi:NAD(P)H-dependent oxidoreductase [Patescibacteria group bacterium]|nr:NAD(P)H-dependent oxidoreductase [Patescibacteria group bacterium]
MDSKPQITLVLGTAREGRQSEKVAKAALAFLSERDDFEVEFVDVRDHMHGRTIPPWENNPLTNTWREIVRSSHGFIIVTPEYNHGYPGELKMLLDQAYKEYEGKKVALCTVSSGGFGGVRVAENLLPVLHELGLEVLKESIIVPKVEDFSGDADEKFTKNLGKVLAVFN